jgi:hypothetical protein
VVALLGLCILASGFIFLARPEATEVEYQISWIGDTYIGDRGEDFLATYGYDAAFARFPDIGSADLTIVNVETPITAMSNPPEGYEIYYKEGSPTARYAIYTSRGRVTRYVHRSPPPAAQSLARQGVDVVTLANNHTLDQGLEGLIDTQHHLRSAGITCIGAGEDWGQAAAPYLVDTPHGRVAIFAFGKEMGTAPAAGMDTAGIFSLSSENLDIACAAAKAVGARWKVAAVHWGRNYSAMDDYQRNWAEGFARRGFDLVVGHGPHVVHQAEVIGRTLVLFSLGNGMFMTKGRYDDEWPGFGLVATTVLSPSGFREARLTCVEVDNMKVAFQPRTAEPEDAARVLTDVWPGIELQGATGTLRW